MPLRAHLPPSKKEEIAASWPVENGPCVLALLGPVRVGIHTSNTCLLRKLFHSFSSLSLSLPFSVSYSSIFVDYLMARQREREREWIMGRRSRARAARPFDPSVTWSLYVLWSTLPRPKFPETVREFFFSRIYARVFKSLSCGLLLFRVFGVEVIFLRIRIGGIISHAWCFSRENVAITRSKQEA